MKISDSLLFIETLPSLNSAKEVGDAFLRTIAPFGFPMVSCGGSRDTPTGRAWDFFFNTWPADWLVEYQNNDYVRLDVMPAVSLLTGTPFTWQEMLRDRVFTPKQLAFHERIRSLGVMDGYAVPIHYPGGDTGLCVSVADHPVENMEERLALHMASIYALDRCRELGGTIDASSVKSPLSPRETDCLKHVLNGKSDTDIGEILGISHTTVHFHVERVKKKLGVRTRTQAATMVRTLGYL